MAEITQSRVLMPTLLYPDRQVVNSRGDFADRDRQNLIPRWNDARRTCEPTGSSCGTT